MAEKIKVEIELTVSKVVNLYSSDVFTKDETKEYLKKFKKIDLITSLIEDEDDENDVGFTEEYYESDDTDKKDIAVKKENKKDVIDTEIYDGDEDTTEEEDFDDILG